MFDDPRSKNEVSTQDLVVMRPETICWPDNGARFSKQLWRVPSFGTSTLKYCRLLSKSGCYWYISVAVCSNSAAIISDCSVIVLRYSLPFLTVFTGRESNWHDDTGNAAVQRAAGPLKRNTSCLPACFVLLSDFR